MLIDFIIAACLWIAGLYALFVGFIAVCLFAASLREDEDAD